MYIIETAFNLVPARAEKIIYESHNVLYIVHNNVIITICII